MSTIRIRRHPDGLLIQLSNTTHRSAFLHLSKTLQIPINPAPNQSAVIDKKFAYRLLEHFEHHSIVWDNDLKEFANNQLERYELQKRAKLEVSNAISNSYQMLADYSLLERLDPHQVEAVASISVPSLQGIAIFDEQGTGKTVMTLCGFDRLVQTNIIDKLIVIAPKSVLGGWLSDTSMLFGQKYKLQLVSGASKQRRKQIKSNHDILVLSYGTAVSDLSLLRSTLSFTSSRYMLAIDESFYVKNPKAQRTNAVLALRGFCDRAIVLCGTPTPNSPQDIVQQINIADSGLTFDKVSIPKDKEAAFPIIVRSLENTIYLRRLKHDVLPELAHKEVNKLTFNLQPRQANLYAKALNELILSVTNTDDQTFKRNLASFLARRITLLQICSHPSVIAPDYDETPAKLVILDSMLQNIIVEQGKKVVLWSYYRFSLDTLAQRYGEYGLVRIDGSITSTQERIDAIQQFQNNPNCRIFLGNAAAAGAGITLTAAHHAIYESFSNQAAHYMQSVDRIHRRGQNHGVKIHVLLAQDTIEPKEFERIYEKEMSSRHLLGDPADTTITRERFLAELGYSLESQPAT